MLDIEGIRYLYLVPHDEFRYVAPGSQCILGFLNCQYRKKFLQNFDVKQYRWPSYIHASSVVSPDVVIEPGVFIGPQCHISYMSKVGAFGHVAAQNLVGHDSWIGENTVLTPGVTVTGGNRIGNNVWFGARCIVRDQITIADDCEFAIGTVIRKSVTQSGKYYNRNNALGQY